MANATTPTIQINDGKVGIGIATPTAKLHIANGDIRILNLDSASGQGWDTEYFLGSSDSQGNPGVFPTYVPADSHGMFAHKNSDGAFFGITPTGVAGNYHGAIYWGDDAGEHFKFFHNGTERATLTNLGAFSFDSTLTIGSIANANVDTDKFLVSNSGIVEYRTGAQVLSDIGGAPAAGSVTGVGSTNYFPIWTNTTGTIGNSIMSQSSTQRVQITSAGADFLLGQWDGANNRLESAGRPLLITTYTGTINLGISGNTTMSIGGTNVGIGTTSPTEKLDVRGTGKFRGASYLGVTIAPTATGGNMYFYEGNNPTIYLESNGPTIFNAGNVGIGTTSPDSKLDVKGPSASPADGNQTLSITNTTGGTQLNLGTAENSYGWIEAREGATLRNLLLQPNGGNVGIGTTSPSRKFQVTNAAQGDIALFTNTTDADLIINLTSGVTLLSPTTGVLALGTGSSERMRIESSGTVLIGKTSTSNAPAGIMLYKDASYGGLIKLTRQVNTGATQYSLIFFNSGGGAVGSISTTEASTAYNTSSDYRLKEDLKDFNGLDMVSNISVYDYKWKAEDSRSYGVMAHELQEVIPNAVSGEKDAKEMQGVDYSKIVPVLIKAIQELTAKVAILEQK
jgi:hypothetical protein